MAFGIDDAILMAGISAGGNLLGGMMGASGQQGVNASQIAFAQQQQNQAQNFNAVQGEASRGLTAQLADSANQTTMAMQDKAMQFSSAQADIARRAAMEYNTQMASTAYQRTMQDMRAAGLNPILAATLGATGAPNIGTGAPTGASGQGASGSGSGTSVSGISAGSLGNPGALLGSGVASALGAGKVAMDLKATQQNIDQSKSTTELNKQSELVKKAEEDLTKGLTDKARQDTVTSAAQQRQADAAAIEAGSRTANNAVTNQILQHDVTSAAATARIKNREATDAEKYGSGPYGQAAGALSRTAKSASEFVLGPAPAEVPSASSGARSGSVISGIMDWWNNRHTR